MNEEHATAPGGIGKKLGSSDKREILLGFLNMKAMPHKNRMYQHKLAELDKQEQAVR